MLFITQTTATEKQRKDEEFVLLLFQTEVINYIANKYTITN